VAGIDPYWAGTLRFRIISKIALGATLAAIVVLVSAMLFFSDEKGMDYLQLMQFRSVTQENLGSLLAIAGLFLLVCIGALSWVLALYGSFRVAGPLYRLSRNLEQASISTELPGVRQGDCFQDVSHQLHQAVDMVHEHYACMGQQFNMLEELFESRAEKPGELEAMLVRLKENVHRVRLD